MKVAKAVLIANIPTLCCAVIGGILVDRGHPWFAILFLMLAYSLAHEIRD